MRMQDDAAGGDLLRDPPKDETSMLDKARQVATQVKDAVGDYFSSNAPATTPTPTPTTTESKKKKIYQKLQREVFVDVQGQEASVIEMNASVLPTLMLDPRAVSGYELVRITNGSPFSGEYLLTEVVTTYGQGKRTRTLAGVGTQVDGLVLIPLATMQSRGKASEAVASANTKASSSPSASSGNTSTSPSGAQVYYDTKSASWKEV